MENLTELIKAEIKKQYGSITKFATTTGIPTSTLNSAFPKGIETSSYDLVMRICTILRIKRIYDEEITYVNKEFYDMVRKIECLDDQGITIIKALLNVEFARCEGKQNKKRINRVVYMKNTDEKLKDLIRKVLSEQETI